MVVKKLLARVILRVLEGRPTRLAGLVLAAPTMIRMWIQPDEPGETTAVGD